MFRILDIHDHRHQGDDRASGKGNCYYTGCFGCYMGGDRNDDPKTKESLKVISLLCVSL